MKDVWNVKSLCDPPPFREAGDFQAPGARAIFYDGMPYRGKPTAVFAWLGMPQAAASGRKVPGIILVHGGLGTAFDDWVRLWTGRGYAAIAMDTCGCTPTREGMPHGYNHPWPRHSMGGPAGWGGFAQVDEPLHEQWMYHAVADVILANSLLRSLPQVDPDRIGLTGVSWGGVLACIASGVDYRLAFAAPVYGCGFFGTIPKSLSQVSPEQRARWIEKWDPKHYLDGAKLPMLWVTGTNDFGFSPPAIQASYRLAPGPRTVCVRVRMVHGHGGPGERPAEIQAFADSICMGGRGLCAVEAQGHDGAAAWIKYRPTEPVVWAELNYTTSGGNWADRRWVTVQAENDQQACRAWAVVPDGATAYYFNLVDQRGLVVSGEHVEAVTR